VNIRTQDLRGAIGWFVPAATLVLMPKCPACVAAYVAVAGIGLSMSTASYMRLGILTLCTCWLSYLLVKRIWRRFSSPCGCAGR